MQFSSERCYAVMYLHVPEMSGDQRAESARLGWGIAQWILCSCGNSNNEKLRIQETTQPLKKGVNNSTNTTALCNCSLYCAVCSVNFAVCSVQCALRTLCNLHCAGCSVQCAVSTLWKLHCSALCAVCSVQCEVSPLCNSHCAVFSMQFEVRTLCRLHCAVCSV